VNEAHEISGGTKLESSEGASSQEAFFEVPKTDWMGREKTRKKNWESDHCAKQEADCTSRQSVWKEMMPLKNIWTTAGRTGGINPSR